MVNELELESISSNLLTILYVGLCAYWDGGHPDSVKSHDPQEN